MTRLDAAWVPEIAAVLLTGLGKFLLADWLGLDLAFIVAAGFFWAGFVARRTRADPCAWTAWGFTTHNLRGALVRLWPFAALAFVASVAYGVLSGRLLLHWHMALILLLYPVWGLVQQFIVVALIAGNFKRHGRMSDRGVVLLTALVFAAVHIPSLPLIGVSFVMALITTTVYFRVRNLLALGLFHGWVATLVYFFVLGQDPWIQVVSTWSRALDPSR